MNREKIRKYAELIAKTGANIQKGQFVHLYCDIEIRDFALILVKECYDAGAKRVFMHWNDDELEKLTINYADEESLSNLTNFEEANEQFNLENHPVKIYIESSDPESLVGINQEKYGRVTASKGTQIRKYRDQYDDYCQWVIAGYPSKAWAHHVFPNLNEKEATEKLLDVILSVSRANNDNPIAAWEEHDANLVKKANKLNSLRLKELHYTSKNGTDLYVKLLPNVKWEAGGEYTKSTNIHFQPNIPTEECFTTPDKFGTNGIVYSEKPLSYRGQIIDNFSIKFENGKAVEVHAEKGELLLKDMINLDDNACYLGECALVPFHSPINDSKILFFSTLYDENACCHLALGAGFQMLVDGYENLTKDEMCKMGINNSIVHTDFMIGSSDLRIEAVDFEGKKHLIFENGDWADIF